ncbi:hypothetical protein AB0I93_25180 [Streptomyces sp. NPDC049967]|nr:hypothetical protein [Streptomyces sp. NBC_00342]
MTDETPRFKLGILTMSRAGAAPALGGKPRAAPALAAGPATEAATDPAGV